VASAARVARHPGFGPTALLSLVPSTDSRCQNVRGVSIIEISRDRNVWRDRLRAYRIMIDREDVGRLRPGETGRYEVLAGRHQVEVHIDWASSPQINVEVADGEIASLRCRPSGGVALFSLFRPHEYIRLERVSGSALS